MLKKRHFLLIIIFICILIFAGLMEGIYFKNSQRLLNYNDEFWNSYVEKLQTGRLNSDGVEYEAIQENGKDYVNYFTQADLVIQYCYSYAFESEDDGLLELSKKKMNCMMNTFHEYGKFPRPEYKAQNYEYGWVSSMDAPTIMIASEMLYELTGENIYREFIYELKDYVLLDTKEGGFNYVSEGGYIWPLEYARVEADEETNLYVLNGSLLGYNSVKAMSKILHDSELKAYCKRVEATYKKRFAEFQYSDSRWSYYMLHPQTVISIHYMIFEKKLFETAYYLNKNKIFYEQMKYREECLKSVLRPQFFRVNDEIEYYLHRAASPHMYQIDTYATLIEIYDKHGNIIAENYDSVSGALNKDKKSFYNSMFLHGKVKEDAAYYKVYSFTDNRRKYLLFKGTVSIEEQTEKLDVFYEANGIFDAEKMDVNNSYMINRERDEEKEGDIVFSISPQPHVSGIYALEISNMAKSDVYIGLKIYDTEGIGATRYYTPLCQGNNLILFDERGFAAGDRLKDIDEIWLRIYDESVDEETFEIKVNNLYLFKDYKNLYDYIYSTDYLINPQ